MKSYFIHSRCLSFVRATTSRAIPAAIIFFSVLLFTCSAYGQSVPGLQAPDKPKVKDDTPNAVKAARGEVPFSRKYGHLKLSAAKIKRLARLNPSEQNKRKDDKLLRIGVVRPLLTPLDPLSDSELYTVDEGYIRVAGVVSEGAVAVRVQFKDMALPAGARVFVYSPTNPNEYYGPYTGRGASEDGTFWTPPIHGDSAIIEYFTPAGSTSAKTPFRVDSIAHTYKDLSVDPDAAAASCELEVTPDWQNVAKSVGRIDFVTRGLVALCTGTLLNNTANDQKPYFLTANHCISSQTEAQSAVVYWNYNTGESPFGFPQTNGANLLVTGTSSDFTLLFLTGSMPGGLFFSGWDASSFNGTAAVTGIHHPKGSHKRISFGTARQPGAGDCFPGEQCLRVDWSSGTTEPGSSGSGVWTGNPSDPGGPRIIGSLTGGVSSCSVPSQNWDVYGRFSVTYPSVASFLDATTCVTSLSSSTQIFTNAGGSGSVTVTASGSCNWTAVSSDSFITITSGSSGAGTGTINFSIPSNNGPQRTAQIVVAGQVINITQFGGGVCAPTPISIGQTVNGNLTTNDCPFGDGTYLDAYSFTGTAGQRIAISMSSADFDTYLYLNRPDGSTLAENDDFGVGFNSRIPRNGFITLPETGAYTIWANAFDPEDTTGAYSLSISVPVLRTLTVTSSSPTGAVDVGISTPDNNGQSSGPTPFTRIYDQGTTIILSVPSVLDNGAVVFLKWQKDGVDLETSTVTVLTMDGDHTMTAVFITKPNYVLTVASTNPSSGVPIEVSETDQGGLSNGTTQFTRTYGQGRGLTLKAPVSAGGNYFQKWQRDGVDQTINRSTSVVMNSNQTMTAVYITIPPTPTPTPTPTPSGPGQAVTYQIDPAHTGSQFDNVSTPLMQRWSRDLGSSVSYPLIAGGKVFVLAGTTLYALNGTTGATVWGPIDIGTYPNIAYGSGRVYAINNGGLLRAFDATSGSQVWSRQLVGQFSSPPTATGGTIYLGGGSTFYAVAEQDGTIKWSTANAGGDHSSPAVTPSEIYVSYACNRAFSLSISTGVINWQHPTTCFGPGGRTPVFYNGRVYTRDTSIAQLVLDSGTGITVDEYNVGPAPAFHGSTGFFLLGSTLTAKDINSGTVKWSFTGDGNLSSAPIVVHGVVYIGSLSGKLYALDENTGANIWSGTVGAPVNRPDEHNMSEPLTGLGAGEGLIVVPASNLVVAYQSAPIPTPMVYAEEGTNNALALDSVTFVRGPFRLTNPNNFSFDQRTRLIILTTNLGLTQSDLNDPAVLVVELGGVNLPVENVGSLALPELGSSYIIVRLPDNAPTGPQELRIKLRGVTSDAKILTISP